MSLLAEAFVQYLVAMKQRKGAPAVQQAAAEVMAHYINDQPDADDKADAAIRTIIDKADAENAFEFLAHLV